MKIVILKNIFITDEKRHLKHYEWWEVGSFWLSVPSLTQFADAIIHPLFFSVKKVKYRLIDKWLNETKRKLIKISTKDIAFDSLCYRLDWCKV